MKTFIKRVWDFLMGRSYNPTAGPTPPNPAYGAPSGSGQQSPTARPIDVCSEEDIVLGLDLRLGTHESVYMGPDGEYRRAKRHISVLCGCGHIIRSTPAQESSESKNQQPNRKLEGECCYCSQEYDVLVLSGKLSPAEAQRLSLVCSDCARITVSGKLACRKHTEAITDQTGQTIFLGPDDQVEYQRQKTLHRFTGILAFFVTEERDPEDKSNDTSDK